MTSPGQTTSYRLSATQASSSVTDETVILDLRQGLYFGLNASGAVIWDRLMRGPATVAELESAVLASFEVDTSECRRDLEALLQRLLDERLVERCASGHAR